MQIPQAGLTSKGRTSLRTLLVRNAPSALLRPNGRQDMARDLLELVVDGPELDGIWAAYQEDPDEANQMDEEEMESQLLSDG